MNDASMKAFSARISGIVQGVGFRYSCVFEANRLHILGFVRNSPDGSVEVTAEGAADKIDQFRSWLKNGPRGALVQKAEFNEQPYQGRYARFSIDY